MNTSIVTARVMDISRRLPRVRALAPIVVVLAIFPGAGDRSSELLAQGGAVEEAPFETMAIRPNVFVIFGAGGNVVVQVGQDGVILVNSGSAAMAEKVLSAIRALTQDPIRYIINTSADPEFVGANGVLAKTGLSLNPSASNFGAPWATILAREEVLARMSASTGMGASFPVEAWPAETYAGKQKSMYLNGEGIQVLHVPAAHSDSDSIVFFRRADVVVTGDVLDLRHFPVIDVSHGGTIQGEINALNRLMELAIPPMPLVTQEGRTLLVPGHGQIADQIDLVEYRDMVTIVRDRIQNLIDKGMTMEQVKAANPTAGFRGRYGADTGAWTTDMFVEAVYAGLARKR